MPDQRQHRGPHPEDALLFARDAWPKLQHAVEHLSWLLTRGYAEPSALKLVGDHFQLAARQRIAVRRAACADQALAARAANCVPPAKLAGCHLALDGFNLLTTVEAALAGGVLLCCRDRCVRDMASVHGSYRKVLETQPALEHIGTFLATLDVSSVTWWLDRPVSNSGRLRQRIEQTARQHRWQWTVELVPDADRPLQSTSEIVVSADSGILDRCHRWSNITPQILTALSTSLWLVPMVGDAAQLSPEDRCRS